MGYQENLFYMPYTAPYSLLGSNHWNQKYHPGKQSDMWAKGQPDGQFTHSSTPTTAADKFTQPCVVAYVMDSTICTALGTPRSASSVSFPVRNKLTPAQNKLTLND